MKLDPTEWASTLQLTIKSRALGAEEDQTTAGCYCRTSSVFLKTRPEGNRPKA